MLCRLETEHNRIDSQSFLMLLPRDLLILLSIMNCFQEHANSNRYAHMPYSATLADASCFSLCCYARFTYLEDRH